MFTPLFSHAGHAHTANSMDMATTIDHCMPIIIGAGIIVLLLLAVIVFLLITWEPKKPITKKATSKKNNRGHSPIKTPDQRPGF